MSLFPPPQPSPCAATPLPLLVAAAAAAAATAAASPVEEVVWCEVGSLLPDLQWDEAYTGGRKAFGRSISEDCMPVTLICGVNSPWCSYGPVVHRV